MFDCPLEISQLTILEWSHWIFWEEQHLVSLKMAAMLPR